MPNRIFVRKYEANLWQWRLTNALGDWQTPEYFTGDINLLAQTIAEKPVVLILPGHWVVSQLVDTDIKDKRLQHKVIPYQLEDTIVESIDDLVFAFGPWENNLLPVAYLDEASAQTAIQEIEATGAQVVRCLVDYLELAPKEDEWVLILENQQLMAAFSQWQGFVIENNLAPLYLCAALAEAPPKHLRLVAETPEDLEHLQTLLPNTFNDEPKPSLQLEIGGFWEQFAKTAKPHLDFRTGRLARKLPLTAWAQAWKTPLTAIAAAFVLALGTQWIELVKAQKQYKKIIAERDHYYRQIVPGNGSIVNPVAALKSKLGGSSATQGSHLAAMMSYIGPAMAANPSIKLTSFRYTAEAGELQLSLETKDIATLDTLRSKIKEAGLASDLKRVSASGDMNQAQMLITENKS